MLQTLRKNKGQNTAEYAILIALVIGGVIGMQQYIQRGFQGRMRDATVFLRDESGDFGNTLQYEPYYTNQSADIDRQSFAKQAYNEQVDNEVRTRRADEFVQETTYVNTAVDDTTVGIIGEGM